MSDQFLMSDENPLDVYTGQISFTLFQLCGIWRPDKCDSEWKLKIYDLYKICTITIYTSFSLSLFVYMLQEHEDVGSFTQSVLYFFTYFNVFIKMTMVVIRRKNFIKSNKMLLSNMCRSCDSHETEIVRNCSQIGRVNTIRFLIVVHITAITIALAPLTSTQRRTLPYKNWLPFSLESQTLYILAYLHQVVCILMIIYISIGVETLALTVMLQICGQLEIIMYRLNLLPDLIKNNKLKHTKYSIEDEIIKHCIRRHLYIYSIGDNINKQFGIVIFVQFFASIINICALIYNMASVSVTNRVFWIMMSSVGSYVFQIFIYCYYGDKMTEKSADVGSAIYSINWDALTVNTQKSLITIMIRSTRPIKLTASSIIIMSIETFMKIMKSAYTAYNVLK